MCLFEGRFCFFFWLLNRRKQKYEKLTTIITHIYEVDKNPAYNVFRLFGLKQLHSKQGANYTLVFTQLYLYPIYRNQQTN